MGGVDGAGGRDCRGATASGGVVGAAGLQGGMGSGSLAVHTVHRHGFTVGNGEAVCKAPSKPLLSPAYVRGAPGEEDALVVNASNSSWEGSYDDSSSGMTIQGGRKGGRCRAGGVATGDYQRECKAALEQAFHQAPVGVIDAKDLSFQLKGDIVAAEDMAEVVIGLLSQHPKVQSLPASVDLAAAFVAVMGDD